MLQLVDERQQRAGAEGEHLLRDGDADGFGVGVGAHGAGVPRADLDAAVRVQDRADELEDVAVRLGFGRGDGGGMGGGVGGAVGGAIGRGNGCTVGDPIRCTMGGAVDNAVRLAAGAAKRALDGDGSRAPALKVSE